MPILECDNAITEAEIRASGHGFKGVEAFAEKLVNKGKTEGALYLDFGAGKAVALTIRDGVAYARMIKP